MQHQTFTGDATLATIAGQGTPGAALTSYAIWRSSFSYNGAGVWTVAQPTGNSAHPTIVGKVHGTPGSSGGNPGAFITQIDWYQANTNNLLSRLTFDSPTFFGFNLSGNGFIDPGWVIDNIRLSYHVAAYSGNDRLIGGAETDAFLGFDGNDTIEGGGGDDVLSGGKGNDVFIYRTGDAAAGEQLSGSEVGGTDIDTVLAYGATFGRSIGNAAAVDLGNVTIDTVERINVNGTEVIVQASQLGAGGFTQIFGRAGVRDILTITNAAGFNINSIGFGTWGPEDIIGFIGSNGSETLNGTDVDDGFYGAGGTDTYNGFEGNDIFIFDESDAGVTPIMDTINGGTHTTGDVIQIQAPAIDEAVPFNGIDPINLTGATITGVEQIEILSGQVALRTNQVNSFTAGASSGFYLETNKIGTIIGSNGPQLLTIQVTKSYLPNANHDLADFFALNFQNWSLTEDKVALIVSPDMRYVAGTSQSDYITVTGTATLGMRIRGEAGHDTIIGTNLADQDPTGAGGWFGLDGGSGNDTIYGLGGVDIMLGGTGNDTLYGGLDRDFLFGDAGNDLLLGEGGNDVLDGGAGTNQLFGGLGNDTYFVRAATDVVNELAGQGTGDVIGAGLTINLANYANIENLAAIDPAATTTIHLTGNSGVNRISGNNGINIFNGTLGNDYLTGRGGRDSFLFNTQLSSTTNRDVITDFVAVDDTIRLENAIFTKLSATGALSASFLRIGTAAADANDYIVYNPATGLLSYDADGNTPGGVAAVQFALLTTKPTLTAADFLVV